MDTISFQYQFIICIKRRSHVLNLESNQKEVFPKTLMEIFVRYLHNDMKKSFYDGGFSSVVVSIKQKVLTSDAALGGL